MKRHGTGGCKNSTVSLSLVPIWETLTFTKSAIDGACIRYYIA